MARLFRFTINRQGGQGKSVLAFTGSYEPDVNYDGINAVEITFENDSDRGIRLSLTKDEAKHIRRQLDEQGI